MSKPKTRNSGDTFRPVVQVLKTKKGEPTSISFNGNQYALVNPQYLNGGKNKVAKKERL